MNSLLLLLLITLVEKREARSLLGWLAVVGVSVVRALGEQQGVQQLFCISGNHSHSSCICFSFLAFCCLEFT